MAHTLDQMQVREALCEMARDFHQRGWMAGTAGNLSARPHEHPGSFWITASGQPKGRLAPQDFLRIAIDSGEIQENPNPQHQPSAEASIHQAIYRLFPQAYACLHVHTVDACLATRAAGSDMPLPALEMIKGLGIWEEMPEVSLPVFDNWLEVPRIAGEIQRRFSLCPPRVPALMIRGHGVTVWGESMQQAYNRLEILEFLMSYAARQPGSTQ